MQCVAWKRERDGESKKWKARRGKKLKFMEHILLFLQNETCCMYNNISAEVKEHCAYDFNLFNHSELLINSIITLHMQFYLESKKFWTLTILVLKFNKINRKINIVHEIKFLKLRGRHFHEPRMYNRINFSFILHLPRMCVWACVQFSPSYVCGI
jgi:hypothetical protein